MAQIDDYPRQNPAYRLTREKYQEPSIMAVLLLFVSSIQVCDESSDRVPCSIQEHYASRQLKYGVIRYDDGLPAFSLLHEQLRSGSLAPIRAQVTRPPWLRTSAGSIRAAGCGSYRLIRAA